MCDVLQSQAAQEDLDPGASPVSERGCRLKRQPDVTIQAPIKGLTHTYQFGSAADPVKCGSVGIEKTPPRASGGFASALSFRVNSVNYAGIATAAESAYLTQLGLLQSNSPSASNWFERVLRIKQAANKNLPYKIAQIIDLQRVCTLPINSLAN